MGCENELDKINLRDIRVKCIVGVNPQERDIKQEVVINLTLYADLSNACQSDDLADTVNYKTIQDDVVAMVKASSYFLLEHLAEQIASACLAEQRVQRVCISVEKPAALHFARTVGIEITRSQES